MDKLNELEAVIGVPAGYLKTRNVSKHVGSPFVDVLGEQVDQSLDVLAHLLIGFTWLELRKV